MINGKTIVLTGATGGIGAALADELAVEGATLVLVARNTKKLTNLVDRLGEKHLIVEADIATETGRNAIVRQCQKLPQGIDMLINNAGIGQFSLFQEMSQQHIISLININLSSTILLTQALLPQLQAAKQAKIINIGSTFGSIGFPGFSVYSATKFALRGFSEALSRELMDSGVSVHYFAPRATKTAINSEQVNQMNKELGTSVDEPKKVAQQLLSFIKADRRQAFIGWPEKLFIRINGLFPQIVDKSILKQLPIIKHYLSPLKSN